jgi:hypothetical protein
VADQRGAIDAFLQRANVCRQFLRQHRHDAIREIHAVAASPRFLVDRGARPHVEADVRDRDDRLPAARIGGVVIGCRPDRIVMIARIGGVDRDDRQVAEVFAAIP